MISLARMNQVLEVDLRNRIAVVEPGVIDLHGLLNPGRLVASI